MMDSFAEIRARVMPEQAARAYGFKPDRSGFICCPFHGPERTPSLKLYPTSWYCFGCHMGGDVVALVGRLHGLTPLDAARKINADFGLCLPLDWPVSPQERELARAERERRKALTDTYTAFESWRDETLRQLCACFRLGWEALRDGPPWTPQQVEAVRWMATVEHWADELDCGVMGREMEIFRIREGVQRVCTKILNATQARSSAA